MEFLEIGVSGISNPGLRFYPWIISFSSFADAVLEFRKLKTFWSVCRPA